MRSLGTIINPTANGVRKLIENKTNEVRAVFHRLEQRKQKRFADIVRTIETKPRNSTGNAITQMQAVNNCIDSDDTFSFYRDQMEHLQILEQRYLLAANEGNQTKIARLVLQIEETHAQVTSYMNQNNSELMNILQI